MKIKVSPELERIDERTAAVMDRVKLRGRATRADVKELTAIYRQVDAYVRHAKATGRAESFVMRPDPLAMLNREAGRMMAAG